MEDGLSEMERDAIDELLYIGAGDVPNLETTLRLPWVQDAISRFKEAVALHGKPSAVLEGRLGHAYLALGEYSTSIEHFSNAVLIGGDAVNIRAPPCALTARLFPG